MTCHDLLRDRQADTGALDAESLRNVAANEFFEDAMVVFRRDADALIANPNGDSAVFPRQVHPHGGLARGIFDGIVEQIPHGASQGFAIGAYGRGHMVCVQFDTASAAFRLLSGWRTRRSPSHTNLPKPFANFPATETS